MPPLTKSPLSTTSSLLVLDTETTGVDFKHGAKPFFVTTCLVTKDTQQQVYWDWDVDPLTRDPIIPRGDLNEIKDLIHDPRNTLVLQNCKFDVRALSTIINVKDWPWRTTNDTLLAGHLLASNQPHNLTDMVMQYLGVDIEPLEVALKDICAVARRTARKYRPNWQIANEGLACMPSASEKVWKYDMWLPKMLAQDIGVDKLSEILEEDATPWLTALADYSNADSASTVALWQEQWRQIVSRKYEKVYESQRKVIRVLYLMEENGVTLNKHRLDTQVAEYTKGIESSSRVCKNIAASYDVDLQITKGVTHQLRNFFSDTLKLPPIYSKKSKSGTPTLNKEAMHHYKMTLPSKSKALTFINALSDKRSRDVAVSYMQSYKKFWLPIDSGGLWYRLYPTLNLTGTDTLRLSSNNPNEQNISKKEGFNLRYCFGPAAGREWWSLDAKNIEARLPAYISQEQDLIDLYERANDPPYYGSGHLLNFHTVYPDIWSNELALLTKELGSATLALAKVGPHCKKKYASTWYQCVKNGGFAVQYGAINRSDGRGTADLAFKKPGAQSLLEQRFSKLENLNRKCINFANKYGYVETVPDRTVDPLRGYPILCTRTEWGKILPTVPLNYYIQGTAMWWMRTAMVRCQDQLDEWYRDSSFDGLMVMQVHDELVFDFPKSKLHPKDDLSSNTTTKSNLWRVMRLKELMEQSGTNLVPSIPTPVSIEYHDDNWSTGFTCA